MRVWLANQAFNAMCEEAIARHPLESGGVLLGWRTGKDRVVIIVLGPGPKALPDNAGIKKGFTLCCLSEPFPVFGSTHLEGGLSRSQVTLGAADHPGYLFVMWWPRASSTSGLKFSRPAAVRVGMMIVQSGKSLK
jgi:hypothetical protein